MPAFASLFSAIVFSAVLSSAASISERASCTISTYNADVSGCSTVTINSLTVPSGGVISWKFDDNAKVTLNGDITFAKTTAAGPLITFDGSGVTLTGAGHKLNGNGLLYWDGQGTNGGVAKPHPLVKIKGSGTYSSFTVLNSPAHAVSVGGTGLTLDTITIDNSAGDAGALGHNTDGFDVSASSIIIRNSVVKNQDDCIAINSGSNIQFLNNQCSGGHGMSVGSIADGKTVSQVTFSGNRVSTSMYGIRIKVNANAGNGASVSGVTYTGNTLTGIAKYGVLISQSYPDDAGTPGTSSLISGVNFTGTKTTVTMASSSGKRLDVDCGNCSGAWNFSGLTITGGTAGAISPSHATITPGSY